MFQGKPGPAGPIGSPGTAGAPVSFLQQSNNPHSNITIRILPTFLLFFLLFERNILNVMEMFRNYFYFLNYI